MAHIEIMRRGAFWSSHATRKDPLRVPAEAHSKQSARQPPLPALLALLALLALNFNCHVYLDATTENPPSRVLRRAH